jgi:hypothetical protein
MRSRGVITMHRLEPHEGIQETVQIVCRLYQAPAEVLTGFDCDSFCCGYDGTAVWALPRCLRALRTGTNLLNALHAWPNRPTYEMRLGKYASRGFAIAIPGLDVGRIDHAHIRRAQLTELHGMARLLKVGFELESAREPASNLSPANRCASAQSTEAGSDDDDAPAPMKKLGERRSAQR